MLAQISFQISSESSAAALTIGQAVLSAYHHQSNGQVKALNSLNVHLTNMPIPAGTSAWHCYKFVLPY